MSAYTQFGYPYVTAGSQLLVPGQTSTASTAGSSCCETGRVVGTDPVSGAPICSCQYDSSRLSALNTYPRLSTGSTLHYSAAYPNGDPQNPYPSIGVDSGYFGTFANPYGLKESGAADMGVYSGIGTTAGYGYSPYDPSLYGYGTPYDLASRRKNATRESTGTLKAWMNEHKKNPYPTKGEKIMLAIITKMTLTQISTWFANARRRLKKENKMTWEPKNKGDSDDEEGKAEAKDTSGTDKEEDEKDSTLSAVGSDPLSPLAGEEVKSEALSPSADWKEKTPLHDCGDAHKPKIWSLADTAVCKTPPPAATAWSAETRLQCHEPVANTFPLPPTIGPGQFPRYPAHAQSQSQSRSLPQSSPTAASYRHGSSAGGGTYGALATYGDAGRDTPPQTPPSLSKQGVAKAATAQHDSGVAGYGGPYPGMLAAPERRTEAYRQQPVTSQQYSQPRAGDVSQQMPSQMSQYGAAYKRSSSGREAPTEYVSPV